MQAFTSRAPGKSILFGEHAVVYGYPAIAVPVFECQAVTTILPNPAGSPGDIWIEAQEIGLSSRLADLDAGHPIRMTITLTQAKLGSRAIPACSIKIVSTIPIASGLGSGAAIAVSLARGLSGFLGTPLPDQKVSAIAFEVDKIYHGTPSGIDNTVIAFEKPIFFIRNEPIQMITPGCPLEFLIADSGIRSSTRKMVFGVKERRDLNQEDYDRIFEKIGKNATIARGEIEAGKIRNVGELMTENHECLRAIGVSHPALDRLVDAALAGGARGAKLSGAGGGGNIVCLVDPDRSADVETRLREAGAVRVIRTEIR